MIKTTLFGAIVSFVLAGSGIAAQPDMKSAAAKVDELVLAGLKKNNVQPNAEITDEVFVRRVFLDIAGRIPTLKETSDFLADKSEDKRAKLIDELLASDSYVQNMFNYWADILRFKSQMVGGGQSAPAGYAYAAWLKEALEKNMPYDQLVRELVTADGKTYTNGAIGFYIRDYNMPLDNMAVTTQIFLGTSMVCAQCHNHPFDKWSQMDYYQMAAHTYGMTGTNGLTNPLLMQAMYGGPSAKKGKKPKKGDYAGAVSKFELPEGMVRGDISKAMSEILRPLRYNNVLDQTGKKALKLPHDYQYTDAKPNTVIEPMIPASFSKDGKITDGDKQPVEAYASWMTSKENPRFTMVIANRLWKKVMGLGLIEPVDEITDSTVPSNPQLMTFLEDTMKSLNYDMKAFFKILYNSKSYQRAAHTKDVELGEVYHFPGPVLRRMSAEQIWDSVVTLYKPNPDAPSIDARLTAESAIRRVEWLDRALNALTPEEMRDCSIEVAKKQKELAAEVRAAQVALNEANKSKDEAAIRKAKSAVGSQRRRLDDAVEEIVYTTGFKKFAQMAKAGKLDEFVKDEEFAAEVASVLKAKKGADLQIDEALNILSRIHRSRYEQQQKQRVKADAERFNAKDDDRDNLKSWERFRDTLYVRACDIRSPAPNGHFLRDFGQSDREIVENASEDASVTQALNLLNGKVFSNLMNPYTMIARSMARAKDKGSDEVIDTVYLSLLSRRATADEKAILREVADNADARDRGDVLWTVLNTRQFFFIE
ncbi:MAG: DUF1549 domain-containing protein [Verrucomicrobiaceae bacterium]|nr:DUF1549 domain-containing protein [Verrucomicrobiaceae bacterium]